MAQALLTGTKLHLVFQVGMDEEGKPIMKSKMFNNIKKDSTTDQLFQAGTAISSLTNDMLNNLERNDSSEIIAE
ncbi:DUF1659 domain-containing protein [Neobacillus kokaensis]|uniref:DUF1659 domain-containing protein n=1 Tax=Neobacillus kokaensis TaxID=2759023 RepID=A0ABQ3N4E4_9BACI|nr:DUF1659 domain-containing protein [Neobacillus kokaensis]GHH99794.1 hypothetical protein AM1BK_33370 [Neobacillus kokaensis]